MFEKNIAQNAGHRSRQQRRRTTTAAAARRRWSTAMNKSHDWDDDCCSVQTAPTVTSRSTAYSSRVSSSIRRSSMNMQEDYSHDTDLVSLCEMQPICVASRGHDSFSSSLSTMDLGARDVVDDKEEDKGVLLGSILHSSASRLAVPIRTPSCRSINSVTSLPCVMPSSSGQNENAGGDKKNLRSLMSLLEKVDAQPSTKGKKGKKGKKKSSSTSSRRHKASPQ